MAFDEKRDKMGNRLSLAWRDTVIFKLFIVNFILTIQSKFYLMSESKLRGKFFLKEFSLDIRKENAVNLFAVKRYRGIHLSSYWIIIKGRYPLKCDSILKLLRRYRFQAPHYLDMEKYALVIKAFKTQECSFIFSRDGLEKLLHLQLRNSKHLEAVVKRNFEQECKSNTLHKSFGKLLKYSIQTKEVGLVLLDIREYLDYISNMVSKSLKDNRSIRSFVLRTYSDILGNNILKR